MCDDNSLKLGEPREIPKPLVKESTITIQGSAPEPFPLARPNFLPGSKLMNQDLGLNQTIARNAVNGPASVSMKALPNHPSRRRRKTGRIIPNAPIAMEDGSGIVVMERWEYEVLLART